MNEFSKERREMHTNVNENKLPRSIIKTALVGFEVKIVALKYADTMCLKPIAFVVFSFLVKMFAINGMFSLI